MSKLFIFGIGGTGSRVLRALTMLMASGAKLGHQQVVPIIIDPDAGNADLTKATTLLNNYLSIHNKIQPSDGSRSDFFNTEIVPIESVQAGGNYLLSIEGTNDKSFKDFIGLSTMKNQTDKALVEMLFSKKNLDSDMKVGFKGNPNIGSVVLDKIVDSQEFAKFNGLFAQGDEIFIINSIFGGTGASGFPLLLKTFRNMDVKRFSNGASIGKARIGAVTVLPYFSLQPDAMSSIDSATFMSKAKSALAYYKDNIYSNGEIDDLYFIGDTHDTKAYANHEGGNNQQNPAHFIEMMAATAIVDFSNSSKKGTQHSNNKAACHELGLKDDNNGAGITFSCFNTGLHNMLFKPMTEFAIMANMFQYRLDTLCAQKLDSNMLGEFNENFYSGDFIKNLSSFLSSYRSWLSEMEDNSRQLKLFNLDSEDDPFNLVAGVKPKAPGLLSKRKYDEIYHELSLAVYKNKKIKPNDPALYAEMYHEALSKIVDSKF